MVTANGEVWTLSGEILHDPQEIRISLHHRKEEGGINDPLTTEGRLVSARCGERRPRWTRGTSDSMGSFIEVLHTS
jgi:hypothetical protein